MGGWQRRAPKLQVRDSGWVCYGTTQAQSSRGQSACCSGQAGAHLSHWLAGRPLLLLHFTPPATRSLTLAGPAGTHSHTRPVVRLSRQLPWSSLVEVMAGMMAPSASCGAWRNWAAAQVQDLKSRAAGSGAGLSPPSGCHQREEGGAIDTAGGTLHWDGTGQGASAAAPRHTSTAWRCPGAHNGSPGVVPLLLPPASARIPPLPGLGPGPRWPGGCRACGWTWCAGLPRACWMRELVDGPCGSCSGRPSSAAASGCARRGTKRSAPGAMQQRLCSGTSGSQPGTHRTLHYVCQNCEIVIDPWSWQRCRQMAAGSLSACKGRASHIPPHRPLPLAATQESTEARSTVHCSRWPRRRHLSRRHHPHSWPTRLPNIYSVGAGGVGS